VPKKGYVQGTKYTVDKDKMQVVGNKVEIKQDNRGSRITLSQRIETNDPSQLAGATLVGAFTGAFVRPMTARFGLGSAALATGGN
jgi:hypothetical protein